MTKTKTTKTTKTKPAKLAAEEAVERDEGPEVLSTEDRLTRIEAQLRALGKVGDHNARVILAAVRDLAASTGELVDAVGARDEEDDEEDDEPPRRPARRPARRTNGSNGDARR